MTQGEHEPNLPAQSEWYRELITPMDDRELSDDDQARTLAAVNIAMAGIEQAVAAGQITGVQVSFEVIDPKGNVEFNYSAPEE